MFRLLSVTALLVSVLAGSLAPADEPRLQFDFEKGKRPPRVLPQVDDKEPLKGLAAKFLDENGKTDVAKNQIKRDLNELASALSPRSDVYKKAVERKLLDKEPTKVEVEYLAASVWWAYRAGKEPTDFDTPLAVKTVAAILDDMVRVRFVSNPDGAGVYIDGVLVGKTSAKPPRLCRYLKVGQKYEIRITKPGVKPHERKDYEPPKDGDEYEVDLKP